MPAAWTNPITPRLFKFLRDLKRNNDREWFAENKARYVSDVRDPLLAFITAFAPRLAKIAPEMAADPRPVGGSLFRIYRDTRFANDKSPYKTHAAMAFRNAQGKDVPGPAYYLHLGADGDVFAGAGIWHPMPDTLVQIRRTIAAHPQRWTRASQTKGCTLDEDDQKLSRPPRGFDPEHPFIEDLKRKSFTTGTEFSERDACSPRFLDEFAKACQKATPLVAFLSDAVTPDA